MAWIRDRPVGLVHRDAARSEDGYTLFCSVRGDAAWLLDPEEEHKQTRVFMTVDTGAEMEQARFAAMEYIGTCQLPGGRGVHHLFEVVLTQEGDQVHVSVVDAMYRMKMFFEDAGKLKFARNMTMPGSIEDEIRSLIRAALN